MKTELLAAAIITAFAHLIFLPRKSEYRAGL